MDPLKVGNFIKEIRKKNNMTQQEFADKYHVTFQAVSKWENGKNLPDISLLKKMSNDFNVSMDSLLDGNMKKSNNNNYFVFIAIVVVIISVLFIVWFNKDTFKFKTISTTCNEFDVSGSLAYDKNKSSIYISKIDYCGEKNNTIYKKIECSLYEVSDNNKILISDCNNVDTETTLDDYLKNVSIYIDNYNQTCKDYSNESLYLEIKAYDNDHKITNYNVPLKVENCLN